MGDGVTPGVEDAAGVRGRVDVSAVGVISRRMMVVGASTAPQKTLTLTLTLTWTLRVFLVDGKSQ